MINLYLEINLTIRTWNLKTSLTFLTINDFGYFVHASLND